MDAPGDDLKPEDRDPTPEEIEAERAARRDYEQEGAFEMNNPTDEQISSAILSFHRAAADFTTKRLRDELESLAEPARKKHGAAVAEDLRAWAKEANVEAMAEWLEAKGWKWLEENPEHAAKVQAALTVAWESKCAGGKRQYELLIVPDNRNTEAWAGGDLDLMFHRAANIKSGSVVLAFPGVPVGADVEEIKPDVTLDENTKAVFGLSALEAIFKLRDWILLRPALDPNLTNGNWLRLLAIPWATERAAEVAERLQRQKDAKDLEAAPRVKVKGRDFRRLPKVAAGVSWAFGGPGIELSRVTVDGREYAPAPDLAVKNPSALVPASYSLLPEDHAKKPHQTLLPIDLHGGEDAPPLPVAIAGATQYAIAPASGKLGLLVMAAAHAGGGKLHKTTLRELTRTINPEATKLVTSHYETVMRGLVQLDGLRLVLPNGLSYRVYECPIPWRVLKPEEYDVPLFVGMTRTFEKTLAAIGELAGASYRGDFLFDLTGAMTLPTRRPGLLRQYIRACAFWNSYWKPGTAGEPDPSRVPEVAAERWAAMTNYLPPAATEYLRANKKGDRRSLSQSIKDTLKDAEALDALHLVKLDKASRHGVRLLPPPEYLEAWQESRKGAHKMPGNGGEG